jgi:ABC-type multidrug transport system fused ATPase/permease subunit
VTDFTPLRRVFAQHRSRLVLTYVLFAVEMLGTLLRPLFLGRAVDGLLDGHYLGLIELVGVHAAYLLAGTLRHLYDTRTFTAIYTEFVTRLLAREIGEEDVSRLSAHSQLARQFVDFLEFDFNYVVEAAYNIIGSLVLLLFYDRTVVLICLLILVPVSRLSYLYGKRTEELAKGANDELERQVDIIASSDPVRIREHYASLRRWQVRLSDQEAWNFGAMELLALVVVTVSLLATTDISSENLQAGSIIGIYQYIQKFTSGLDTIPYTVQRVAALRDLTRRMRLENVGW